MTILLTGGTGYIGSHAAVVAAQSGQSVVLLDNLSNSEAMVVDRLTEITGQKLPFVQADVRDTRSVRQALRDHHVDAVLHFAGLKVIGESLERPIDYYANNVEGTLSLLQAMQAENVKVMVFSSSAAVYGEPHYLPVDEQHPTGATNPYGRSKLHTEEMLWDLAQSDHAWRIACLRYFNPVGAHESGLIGERPPDAPTNLMPFIAQVAGGERQGLCVYGNDYATADGTGVRDFIHVMDLADGHLAALRYLADHPGWEAINLGTGRGHSVLEMVASFERASSRRIPYHVAPRRAGDVPECYADPGKARRLLGWKAQRTLDDMALSTWRFQQRRGGIAP